MISIDAATPVSVSIIGLGKIGAQFDLENKTQKLTHASAILGDSRFKLIAGCDENYETRKKFENSYAVQSFATIKDLMAFSVTDVVIVATETDQHVKNICEVLGYDTVKLVLCEKPITRKFENFDKLKKSIVESKKHVLVNYQRRTELSARVIRSQIQGNQFGKFLGGSGLYSRGYFNNGSHIIDLLEWWFDSEFDFPRLIAKTQKDGDFDATIALQLRDRDFLLQSIPTTSTSILELTLEFELAQLRYVSGGSTVYIDDVVEDTAFQGIGSIVTSSIPVFSEDSISLASVYSDIYAKLKGETSLLASAIDAIDLAERMYGYITKDWRNNASN
jgi:hypothetical protein